MSRLGSPDTGRLVRALRYTFAFVVGAMQVGCTAAEECTSAGFGTECRGANTAICSPRPERNGGGAVVQTSSCYLSACSEHYGVHAAVCMPNNASYTCQRDRIQALAGDATIAFSDDGNEIAVARGQSIEFSKFPGGTVNQVPTLATPTHIFLIDFNGDALTDFVYSSNDGIFIGLGLGPDAGKAFAPETRLSADTGLDAKADFDGDGVADLVVSKSYDEKVIFGGVSPFSMALPIDSVGQVVASGDLDNDGRPELVVAGLGNGLLLKLDILSFGRDRSVHPWTIPLSPTPSSGSINGVPINGTPSTIAITDMDGDGKSDVVLGSLARNILVFHGGAAGFARGPASIPLPEASRLAPAAGGGIVASLQRTPVLAYIHHLGADTTYIAADTLDNAVVPLRVPAAIAPLFRSKDALLSDCK